MSSEPRPLKTFGKPGSGKAVVIFRALTRCDCGCNKKARFVFQVGRDEVEIDDPEAIRALIEEMTEGYKLLFPKAN
jgi:hypothetical protein